jgi:hypothetical protein
MIYDIALSPLHLPFLHLNLLDLLIGLRFTMIFTYCMSPWLHNRLMHELKPWEHILDGCYLVSINLLFEAIELLTDLCFNSIHHCIDADFEIRKGVAID